MDSDSTIPAVDDFGSRFLEIDDVDDNYVRLGNPPVNIILFSLLTEMLYFKI